MNNLVEKPIDLSLHPKGVNTVTKETSLPDDTLRSSINFDISNEGKKKVRQGYTKIYAGTNVHSLSPEEVTHGIYFVEDGTLKRYVEGGTPISLATVSSDRRRRMQYVQVGEKVYYSNGFYSGQIKNDVASSWGVPTPAGPKATVVAGNMAAGRYHLKYTYIRDLEESGASNFAMVDIPAGGGSITLTDLPSDNSCDYLRVYCTQVDGDRFYKQAELVVGMPTYTLTQAVHGKDLATDQLYNEPVGHLLTYYSGRIFWANGNRLYWTESIRYGLYRHDNSILFPERISVLIAVRDGLYVASDSTYYLDGREPSKFKRHVTYPYGAIEGTQHKLYANTFNIDDYFGDVACWMSTKGLVYGQNNGTIKAATEKRLALPEYSSGATTFYEQDGIRKLLVSLINKGGSSNLRASDKVTATVTRANEVE